MESVQRSREAGRNVYYSIDRVLDDFAGDVLTYANSTASTFYRERNEPPATPEMQQAHENIMRRFDAVVAGARADGCDGLQIVAHSLGSVIAYHFLARRSTADVEHLYTIGSPLQKFDLFWPDIMPQAPQLPARSLAWDNFVSFFDPIAGMLRHFEHWGGVANHRLLGGGFLRGHVVYQHSPVFLRRLSRGVCGMELPLRRTLVERIYDALMLLGETLVTPAILGLILGAGIAFLTVLALLVPYLASLTVRWWLDPAYWMPFYEWTGLAFAVMFALVFSLVPFLRASDAHRAQRPESHADTGSGP